MTQKSLDDWLEIYSVGEVDDYYVDTNRKPGKDLSCLLGWFWVCNDDLPAH